MGTIIPRHWKDSWGHRAVITLFSEMSDYRVKSFSDADTLWHQEEAYKRRKWMSKKKRKALMALLNLGLKRLTERQKECIYLYYYEHKTIAEVSVILGIEKSNVYNHISLYLLFCFFVKLVSITLNGYFYIIFG